MTYCITYSDTVCLVACSRICKSNGRSIYFDKIVMCGATLDLSIENSRSLRRSGRVSTQSVRPSILLGLLTSGSCYIHSNTLGNQPNFI